MASRRIALLAGASLLALAGIVGCKGSPPAPGGIVSLSPALTETLWALGVGERQVARSDFCDFPPGAVALPPVGTSLAPDFEAIARLKPALILTEVGQTGYAGELGRIAEFVELPWLSVPEMRSSIEALGARLGLESQAAALLARLEQGLRVEPPAAGPRVLLLLGGSEAAGPHWFMRRNSIHGAALHAAGARNAVDRDVDGNAVLSTEALLELDPDAIVILTPGAGADDLIASFGQLRTLRAAAERRIRVLAGARWLRTGPSVADLASALAGVLGLEAEQPVR